MQKKKGSVLVVKLNQPNIRYFLAYSQISGFSWYILLADHTKNPEYHAIIFQLIPCYKIRLNF